MLKYSFLLLICLSALSFTASADTPAEVVMHEFETVEGASYIQAKGFTMKIARGLIRKTPAAPVADHIEEVSVLKMSGVEDKIKSDFLNCLEVTLKKYTYVGKSKSAEGETVDVYISQPEGDMICEMVIFNSDRCILNSLKGSIPISLLMSMQRQIL